MIIHFGRHRMCLEFRWIKGKLVFPRGKIKYFNYFTHHDILNLNPKMVIRIFGIYLYRLTFEVMWNTVL